MGGILERDSATIGDEAVSSAILCQVPADNWYEGTAVRPNGQVLATRLDSPELHVLDPCSASGGGGSGDPKKAAAGRLVRRFDDATGITNIARLEGYPEAYVLGACKIDLKDFRHEEYTLWRVEFPPGGGEDDEPTAEVIARLPEDKRGHAALCSVSRRTLLLGDGFRGCIWKLDVTTGAREEFISDAATLGSASDEHDYGLNRLCRAVDYLWWNNPSKGLVCRVPIAVSEDGDVRITGPVEVVSDEAAQVDGLAVSEDGRRVYGTDYIDGMLWKMEVDPATGKGTRKNLATDVIAPSCVELLRHGSGKGDSNWAKPKILVLCAGAVGSLGVIGAGLPEREKHNGGGIRVVVETKQETTVVGE